jgi:hypothetical protein
MEVDGSNNHIDFYLDSRVSAILLSSLHVQQRITKSILHSCRTNSDFSCSLQLLLSLSSNRGVWFSVFQFCNKSKRLR